MHYLIHCFFVINDFIYWRRLLSETEHYTLWLDYSQNINFTEKRQLQFAHHTFPWCNILSTTVLQAPKNGKHIFTTCQITQTMTVLWLLVSLKTLFIVTLKSYEINSILYSDNCQEQYKCKHMFFQMKKLAIDLKIKVVWFCGEPSHGRGLVDAMSSFGCKLEM